MTENNITFNDRKINNSILYRTKRLEDIDVNEILISKKESYRKKGHLNISLDMMLMITLVHYV